MTTKSHTFETMTEGMRPQDPTMDGSTLKFEPSEHGGEFPDMMPQAIKVTDANGRWCVYHPTMEDGKVVKSHGFNLSQ